MPLPQFFVSIPTTLFMVKISKLMSLNNRLYYSYSILLLLFIAMPLVADFIPGTTGFTILLILIAFVGISNSIAQATGYAMITNFPIECSAWF